MVPDEGRASGRELIVEWYLTAMIVVQGTTIALIAHHPLAVFAEGKTSEAVSDHQIDTSAVDQGLRMIGMGVIGAVAQDLEFQSQKQKCQWRGEIQEMCQMFRSSLLRKLIGMYTTILCSLAID